MLDGDDTLKAPSTDVRKSVPKGDVVASLKAGAAVSLLAEHNGWHLVTFDDPKDASRRLEGWIPKLALQTPKPQKPAKVVPKCQDSEMLSINMADGIPKCREHCGEDSDCQKGEGCEGLEAADEKGNRIPYKGVMVCAAHVAVAPVDVAPKAADAKLPTPTATTISIPNPKHLPCPSGFRDTGEFATCQRICDDDRPCPKGLCQAAGWCE